MTTKENRSSIIICIHDILDSCTSEWSKEIAKNLSDYMINRFLKNGYDVCIGKDENQLLSQAVDKYTHAVVIASGTSPKLSDRLIHAIEEKCLEDFYIAGHVLDREEKYFELHHQFYIINLKIHKELNCPLLGEESNINHSKNKPISFTSDGYISQELSYGKELASYNGTMHGCNILNVALDNKQRVIDLGENIRNNKKYFYYEYDHVFLKESAELFYNQYMFNNIVVPFNSDNLDTNLKFTGPVEQYITLGTGLNWVINLIKLGYTSNTKVIFTDINPLVLRYMKKMVEEWDGINYARFYLENTGFLPNNLPYDFNDYILQIEEKWKKFIKDYPDWIDMWSKIKKLSFDYVSIDYMSNYNLKFIQPNKTTIFNASDMFDHVPGVFIQSMKYRIAAENRFLNKLKTIDSNIFLLWSSRSAESFLSLDQCPKFQKVSEIELIDIEKIIRPYWHKDDWNVLRPLV